MAIGNGNGGRGNGGSDGGDGHGDLLVEFAFLFALLFTQKADAIVLRHALLARKAESDARRRDALMARQGGDL